MQDIPCSGYTLKASDLTKFLPADQQEQFTKFCEDGDWESVQTVLADHMPKEFPQFTDAFCLNEESNPCDLERGEVYVNFDDSDLYVRVESPAYKAMKAKGLSPEFNRWTVWG